MPYDIIDTHVHYWQPDRPDRPWDKLGVDLGPPLSVDQLLLDAERAGVTKIVQVTPTIMGYDNRYGIEAAQQHADRIVGVFGRFDPTGADMPARLAQLCTQPTILGIRLTLMKPPWDAWLADGALELFWDEAARLGIPVAVYAPHQARLIGEAARRHPRTRILVDHMTLRHNDPEPFARWPDVLALAGAPNVFIKVSYFPEVAREPYPFVTMKRYFQEIHDRFGADRLIWGSNYPPSLRACTYKQSLDFAREALAFLSDAERAKIFGQTFLRAVGVDAYRRE